MHPPHHHTSLTMHLYATGFNAWRQLEFDSPQKSSEEPDDITSFQKVLTHTSIDSLYASLTYTSVRTASELQPAGFPDDDVESSGLNPKLLSSTAAIAGNGKVAECDEEGTIRQHASVSSLIHQTSPEVYSFPGRTFIQIEAYETGFVALDSDGCVWTWGDERYAACLGREVTSECPAAEPQKVVDLQDLPSGPIKKIAAAGYLGLALTEEQDLYAWGGHPSRAAILEGLSTIPMYVAVEERDIVDFATGECHIIVVADDGAIYAIGDNTNGQLGLPIELTRSWMKVSVPLANDERIKEVKAGPRSSFIITAPQVP
ncbi:regulator of chromosome condensation 1/beta-lactamase-inhibitor protein II [Xylariaceae sp. FL0016]|nr:regulator of chromosome condensation 1/beta-lactamase-inhibitor protein II [Xylariaceae sp. FL0016]